MLLHDIRHCLASIAYLARLHVLFFVSLVSPVPGHASDDVIFQIKMLVCFFFFSIASSNILTWTVGYSKLSSGNFTVLCCAVLEYIVYWKTRSIFAGHCYGSFFFFFFFFFVFVHVAWWDPWARSKRVAIALRTTLWRIWSILFHIRLRGLFLKNLSQWAALIFIKKAFVGWNAQATISQWRKNDLIGKN